jgi:hypothetical protein
MADKELYEKLLDTLVTLHSVNMTFTPFSAQDIKGVIAAKLKAKTSKEQKYLEHLYKLEKMIRELRELFDITKYSPTECELDICSK